MLGAALAPRLIGRLGSARAVLVAAFGGSIATLLMPVGMVAFAVGGVGYGIGVVVFSIATRTHRQSASPPELLSRVLATVRFVSWGAIPFGAFAGGVLASAIGTRAALLVCCVLTLLAPAVLWWSDVRRLRDLADERVLT